MALRWVEERKRKEEREKLERQVELYRSEKELLAKLRRRRMRRGSRRYRTERGKKEAII